MNNQLRAGLTAEEQLLLRLGGPYEVAPDDAGLLVVRVSGESIDALAALIERLLNTASGHA